MVPHPVTAGLVLLYTLLATSVSAAPPPPAGTVPQACVSSGQTLQSQCRPELDAASKAFGVTNQDQLKTTKISDEQISTYLSKVSPPSSACCKAACDFNSHYCNCDPTILGLAASFTGNNEKQYIMITDYFANKCGFTLHTKSSGNCPSGDLSKEAQLTGC